MACLRSQPGPSPRARGSGLPARLCLAALFAALAVMPAACAMPVTPDSSRPPDVNGHGASVDIGNGRTLFLACAGEGSPTVILESGLHESSQAWTESSPIPPATGPDVFSALAQHTQVCRYDRPGTVIVQSQSIRLTDRSTPVANPRTIDQTASDLERLVSAAALSDPFVLVGHSMGGWMSIYYAQSHPDADLDRAWSKNQQGLAALVPNTPFILAQGTTTTFR